jgi:hypothetical protein
MREYERENERYNLFHVHNSVRKVANALAY